MMIRRRRHLPPPWRLYSGTKPMPCSEAAARADQLLDEDDPVAAGVSFC